MAFDLSSFTNLFKGDPTQASMKGGVLGVDIGASSIKIVDLTEVKGTPTLRTYGEILLGPYEGLDLGRDTHLPERKKIEALVDIIRESEALAKTVAFSLSYNSTFTTAISIPTLDVAQIGTMIPIEARKYVPTALSKVDLDWFPIGTHEAEKTTQVLISAIYTEALMRYETVVQGAGLAITAREIEIFSSVRSLLSPEDQNVAVLDVGALATRMYLVSNGIVHKTHSVPLSGVALTHALKNELRTDFGNAEEMKREFGLRTEGGDERIQKILQNEIARGVRELHTVITRSGTEDGIVVTKVILCGGGSFLPGLPQYMQDVFSLPVVLGEPFRKVAYPAYLEDTLKSAGPSFAVAIGVALSAFEKKE